MVFHLIVEVVMRNGAPVPLAELSIDNREHHVYLMPGCEWVTLYDGIQEMVEACHFVMDHFTQKFPDAYMVFEWHSCHTVD